MQIDSMLNVFVFETLDITAQLEDLILLAEQNNYIALEQINEIMRLIHVIKGSASMMEFDGITKTAHLLEDLYAALRNVRTTPDAKSLFYFIFDLSLKANDYFKAELKKISYQEEPSGIDIALTDKISYYCNKLRAIKKTEESPEKNISLNKSQNYLIGINSEKINDLINLSEKIKKIIEEKNINELIPVSQELNNLIDSIRKISVVPTCAKLRRAIRDLSKKTGKKVEFTVIGEDVEVDKNIIDRLSPSLIQLVRNAVDHGIEHPTDREKSGKPPYGKIIFTVTPHESRITFTISDDGTGIDRDGILQNATEKGLWPLKGNSAPPDDRALFDMIFLPGFTTVPEPSEISGRGMGLDIVKTTIEQLSGTLSIDSIEGNGTALTIDIPINNKES